MSGGVENVHGGFDDKKRVNPGDEKSDRGTGLRTLYAQMFRGYGILPGDLARQSPFILFKMMDALYEKEEENETQVTDEHLRIFYGM